jgi:trehalose/maltose hydrolase-like predicted phosphorylase
VFNGPSTDNNPSHRARTPSLINFHVNGMIIAAGLDLERAIYYRRILVNTSIIEQRLYAHRKFKHLLIHELELLSPMHEQLVCTTQQLGPKSNDISYNFQATSTPANTQAWLGSTLVSESSATPFIKLAVVFPSGSSNETKCVMLSKEQLVYTYPVVIVTSIEFNDKDLVAIANKLYLQALEKKSSDLQDQHIREWQSIWASRLEVDNLDIARVINSRYSHFHNPNK